MLSNDFHRINSSCPKKFLKSLSSDVFFFFRFSGKTLWDQFKNHGISLRRDSEVSITHGMFMNSGGRVTYMDNGSTNGTEVDG